VVRCLLERVDQCLLIDRSGERFRQDSPSLWRRPIPSWPCRLWCEYSGFGGPKHRLGPQAHQAEGGLSQNSHLSRKDSEYYLLIDHLRHTTIHEYSWCQILIRKRTTRPKTNRIRVI